VKPKTSDLHVERVWRWEFGVWALFVPHSRRMERRFLTTITFQVLFLCWVDV
jgi:hypothetical protein